MALSFHLIYYGMAGLRHGPVHVVRSAVVSVLMALNATQVRGRACVPAMQHSSLHLIRHFQLSRRPSMLLTCMCSVHACLPCKLVPAWHGPLYVTD